VQKKPYILNKGGVNVLILPEVSVS